MVILYDEDGVAGGRGDKIFQFSDSYRVNFSYIIIVFMYLYHCATYELGLLVLYR